MKTLHHFFQFTRAVFVSGGMLSNDHRSAAGVAWFHLDMIAQHGDVIQGLDGCASAAVRCRDCGRHAILHAASPSGSDRFD